MLFARISLAVFWSIMTVLGLIVIKRKRSGEISGFGGRPPSDVPRWACLTIPLAILSFIYLSALTIIYVWFPNLVLNYIFYTFPLDTFTLETLENIGGGLTLLGTMIFLTAFFHLGSSIRLLLPKHNERTQLMTDGWYAHSRNPLYFGLHVSMIGWTLIFPNVLVVVTLVIFLANQHFRILLEEDFLEEQFGDEYRDYKKQVRRYI